MSVTQFIESGTTFEFDAGNCFRIENDPIVAQGNVRGSTQNNKACECVTVIDNHHYFIEVKKVVLPSQAKDYLGIPIIKY